MLQVKGQQENMDRERRIGENPGPARSDPNNASVMSDLEVARHARKALGLALKDAWRHTPHRNRLSGISPHDVACFIPITDIAREFALREVIGDAVREVCQNGNADQLTVWILDNLTISLDAMEATNV